MSRSARVAVVRNCTSVLADARWLLALRGGRSILARLLALRKLAARGLRGGLLVAALVAGVAQANGPFFGDLNSNDPGDGEARPALVDIDNDGDQDAFVGSDDGTLRFYRNTGSPSRPAYTLQTDAANPFNGVDAGSQIVPTFVDIDSDSDQDAFIGLSDGTVRFFRNTGSAASPTFVEVTAADNPLSGIDVGDANAPAFVDIDSDGDQDAFIGSFNSTVRFFRNTGSAASPIFVEATGADNPLSGVDVGNKTVPTFVDIDQDGDQDAFIGTKNDAVLFYRNTGSAASPAFTAVTGAANPFTTVNVGLFTAPDFADLDADGDQDAFIGTKNSTVHYYDNTGDAAEPMFRAFNPLVGIDVGLSGAPVFVDQDADGDQDAFIGADDGVLRFFRNTGSAMHPVFEERLDAANPFGGVDVGNRSAATFGDLDKDGDQDALLGSDDGMLRFFRNTGSAASPEFVEVTSADNPLSGVDVGDLSVPSLVDIDSDGDQDVFVSGRDIEPRFFRNTGSAASANFTEQAGPEHPLNGLNLVGATAVTFVDIDNDSDQDAYAGQRDGTLRFFRNTGSARAPRFEAEAGTKTALSGIDVGTDSSPAFADIDGDGDQDAFIGTYNGNINVLRNLAFLLVTATAVSPSQINLSWTDTTDTELGFEIERSSNGATGWTRIATVGNNVTRFSDTGLPGGTTFFYRVRAITSSAASEYSDPVQATTSSYQMRLPLVWQRSPAQPALAVLSSPSRAIPEQPADKQP